MKKVIYSYVCDSCGKDLSASIIKPRFYTISADTEEIDAPAVADEDMTDVHLCSKCACWWAERIRNDAPDYLNDPGDDVKAVSVEEQEVDDQADIQRKIDEAVMEAPLDEAAEIAEKTAKFLNPRKIDDDKLAVLVKAGWTVSALTGEFKCTDAAIYQHIKKLKAQGRL